MSTKIEIYQLSKGPEPLEQRKRIRLLESLSIKPSDGESKKNQYDKLFFERSDRINEFPLAWETIFYPEGNGFQSGSIYEKDLGHETFELRYAPRPNSPTTAYVRTSALAANPIEDGSPIYPETRFAQMLFNQDGNEYLVTATTDFSDWEQSVQPRKKNPTSKQTNH